MISVQFWMRGDCMAVLELPAVPRVGEYVRIIDAHDYCCRVFCRVESVHWMVTGSTYTIQVTLESGD